MKKYLLTFEFRYDGVRNNETDCISKTTTIGVFENIEETIKIGNACLTELEKNFDVRGDRFKLNFLFGHPKCLVTNCCTRDRVHFFGKITPLKYESLTEVVNEALQARKEYDNWKILND